MRLRPSMVVLHRWFGLAVALFLFVSGLTGAVISWDHELDAWLNPQLFHAASGADAGPAKPVLELARQRRPAPVGRQRFFGPLGRR